METPRGDGNEGAPSADRGAEGWAANELADQGWASPLARLGLDRDPFAPGIDLDASVPTVSAERALDFVQLSLMQFSPATLLLGERGTGKTTAIHRLLRRLPGLRAGVVTLPLEEGGDLFEGILGAYGQTAPGPEAAHRRFEEIVAESYEAGRAMLLVVDDAHLASGEDLVRLQDSQRRMGGEVFPLLLLLVGELGLRDRLQDPDLAPLARRVEAITGLGPIGAQETAELVRRRLSVAEAPAELFEDEALAVIHEAARGVPGAVCLLAGLCLTLAAQEGHRVVDAALVRRALEAHVRGTADDADTDPSPPAPDPEPREEPDPEPGGEDDAPPTEPDEEDVLLPPTELPPAYSLSYQDLAELGSLEWEPAPPEEEPSRGPAEVAPPIAEEVAWAHEPADAELPWPWPSDEDAGGTTLPDPGIVAAEAPSGAEVGPPSEAAPAPPLRLVHPVALPKAEASGGPPSWEDDPGPPGRAGPTPRSS